MTDNLRHWSVLGRTDPAHTKQFQRAGGFKGTATRPIWTEKLLTQTFGPCGIGWGCDEPIFNLVPAGEEILVFCTARAWYMDGETRATVYGVGGDKVLVKQQSGLRTDDEAYKKAFTDAIGNAFKHVGAGADVHMGLFDDSKYVSEMRKEFAEESPAPRPPTAAANGATHPANMASSPAPTERAGQNSPTGHGPTATTHASPSEADPFAPEPPKRVDHPRRQEALDAFTRIKKSIEAARLPRVIDDIAKVNTADLALIKEVHAESYNLLMQMMTARKGEMLAAA